MTNTVIHAVAFIAGLVLFLATVGAVISEMLIPRPRRSRISSLATSLANAGVNGIAVRVKDFRRRDNVLAFSGPLTVLVQLLVFIISFLIALALMIFAVDDLGTTTSVYQSGATLLTLGIVAPVNPAQVVITFVAAFTGLSVVAILVGYLLTLYSAYSDREQGLAELSLVAGEPAWGPELLARSALLSQSTGVGQPGGPQQPVPQANQSDPTRWLEWITEIRTTQTGNAVLNHFRSSSPHRNWLIGMLAVLDAAALQLTVIQQTAATDRQVQLLAEGTQTASVLAEQALYRKRKLRTFRPDGDGTAYLPVSTSASQVAVVRAMTSDARLASSIPTPVSEAQGHTLTPGLGPEEFQYACEMLAAAGIALVDDRYGAWIEFARLRSAYFPNIALLAEQLMVVNAPWSGPRKPASPVVWPTLAMLQFPTPSPSPDQQPASPDPSHTGGLT